MLCHIISFHGADDPILKLIATMNGNSPEIKELSKGIYEVGGFNFSNQIGGLEFEAKFPHFEEGFSYGVCDNYEQILKAIPELMSPDRFFAIGITPVIKAQQSAEGGWRWHKWGPYIGTEEPTCEYLYDEPKINKVYCFHIVEMTNHQDRIEL